MELLSSADTRLHAALQYRTTLDLTPIFKAERTAALELTAYGDLPLHTALHYQAPPQVVTQVLAQHEAAVDEKDSAGNLPLQHALAYRLQTSIVKRLLEAHEKLKGQQLASPFGTELVTQELPRLLKQLCTNVDADATMVDCVYRVRGICTCCELDDATLDSVCGHLFPLLCSPSVRLQEETALLIGSTLCHNSRKKKVASAVAKQPAVVEQLVTLLATGIGAIRRHTAAALGALSSKCKQGKGSSDAIKDAVKANPSCIERLAVMANSSDKELAAQTVKLLTLVEIEAKDIKQLRDRGIAQMFAKPWPSRLFLAYQEDKWRKPTPEEESADGKALIDRRIFVEDVGEGTVKEFCHSKIGASAHRIDSDFKGLIEVKLRRKGNNNREWLLPPDDTNSADRLRLHWKSKGGTSLTARALTRGASTADISAWLAEEGGVRSFYAGVFFANDINGECFLELTQKTIETTLTVTIQAHVAELYAAVTELQGFLGRYILDKGPPIHTSATCVLMFGEDRKVSLPDGSLQKVAIKCMKNEIQFETEMVVRQGLDLEFVTGAIRVHAPTDWAFSSTTVDAKLEAHECLDSRQGARKYDKRLTGRFVIIMARAECDLGLNISHGHYAGRDRPRIQRLLRKIVECFRYLESMGLCHGVSR